MKTYHLKWSSHIPNMEMVFTTLFESEGLADVTLMCNGGALKAHRLLLSTCSNYFLRMFLAIDTKRPIISLPEVNLSIAKSLMCFIYTGEVQVTEDKLEELLETAELLHIRGLTEGNQTKSEHSEPSSPKKEKMESDVVSSSNTVEDVKSNNENAEVSQSKKILKSSPSHAIEEFPSTFILPNSPLTPESNDKLDEPTSQDPCQDMEENITDIPEVKPEAIKPPTSSPTLSPYVNFAPQTPSLNSGLSLLNQIQQPSTSVTGSQNILQQEDINKIMSQVSFPSCPICAKECPNFPNLRSHLQSHLQGKPFICEFCDAKFSRASHLCRHRRTHTGEKPFSCKKCGKCFSRQDKLKNHFDRHLADENGTFKSSLKAKPRKKADKLPQSRTNQASLPFPPSSSSIPNLLPSASSNSILSNSSAKTTWNNMAFPGFSNPFYSAATNHLNGGIPGSQMLGGNPILSSLIKLGECSVLQVPK